MQTLLAKIVFKVDELWLALLGKIYGVPIISKIVTNHFHRLYYATDKRTWFNTTWFGVPILKCPFDLWTYQEIFYEVRPDVIIETGTFDGGSALYLAHLCDYLNKGEVLSIDIECHADLPVHERITYHTGSSTSPETLATVRAFVGDHRSVIVILDSDHTMEHVLNELRLYCDFVTPESYLIVEDSNVGGHPVRPLYGKGPMGAIRTFLRENDSFQIDRTREKYYLTFNPSGFLVRRPK